MRHGRGGNFRGDIQYSQTLEGKESRELQQSQTIKLLTQNTFNGKDLSRNCGYYSSQSLITFGYSVTTGLPATEPQEVVKAIANSART